ncbi:I78 family peptidase inhibitor [Comamonas thiooxydans]|uniref:I78 family peptidase inhibitor n=1 Tax=Comamonas thiooxydans TaxID=363952 RepID=UPI000B408616|nr:I78 family peptidase inhibitor [Comamonas thiooxydans]
MTRIHHAIALVALISAAPAAVLAQEHSQPAREQTACTELAKSIVGRTFDEQEKAAVRAQGLTYRVVEIDGKGSPVTMDFNPARLNLSLRDKGVVAASCG